MSNISTAAPSSNFFISFKIKPDVTFIGFITKNRIFTPFWYKKCKNCNVVLSIRVWIWLKYSGNILMWLVSYFQSQPKILIECYFLAFWLYCMYYTLLFKIVRPVVPGGARGSKAPPAFVQFWSVNPILTKGTDHAHQIILTPLDFLTHFRNWKWMAKN